MFPMRDHLYELAKMREEELRKQAILEAQLNEALNGCRSFWSMESALGLWRELFRRPGMRGTPAQPYSGYVR